MCLFIGANLLVNNGIILAEAIGVPERVIAVTFIALGTSLPELMTSVMSLIKGYGNVGLGNVLGANILNLLLVIGIPSAIQGIPVERSTVLVDIPLAILVMVVLFVPIQSAGSFAACHLWNLLRGFLRVREKEKPSSQDQICQALSGGGHASGDLPGRLYDFSLYERWI